MAVPKKRSVALLKSTILNSAQTSHFEVQIIPNTNVRNWILLQAARGRGSARIAGLQYYDRDLKLSCHEASLPGVSFATHELNNKYQNATVKNVYRKTYDQTASFSFYVDKNYDLIYFFENWMSYIMNEDQVSDNNPKSSFRARYPNSYKSVAISISKFEKDYAGDVLTYNFIDAYPASIDSMQVNYQGSQILSCRVNFNYTRYVVGKIDMETNQEARDNRAQEQREAEARANTQNNRNNTGANDLTGVNANIA